MAHTNINNLYPKPAVLQTGNTVVAGQGLAVAGAAVQFAALNQYSNLFFFDVQTADVIVTFDGQTPAAGSKGMRLAAGTNYTWSAATVAAAKFIQASSAAFLYGQEFQI